ncbi:NAD-dependent deacetylase [Comamonas sp. J-3]|uniref:SIR2 family NAD-dependent protein deacylase n=1 Tax=Comamonas trifloxystrobinivorans TaxID=3350256 RepID=UPI00372CB613
MSQETPATAAEQAPSIHQAAGWVAAANRIVVLTGAGISAESGIPTFRDAQTGYWSAFSAQELATQQGYRANPAMVWRWYEQRRELASRAQPNAAHRALAAFEQLRRGDGFLLLTQNVDGLHQRAGSAQVVSLHGDLNAQTWLDTPRDCCYLDWAEAGDPPRCHQCGNLVRPEVVWFDEPVPFAALEQAQRAAQACNLMLVVGTSGVVHPAAGLVHHAARAGAKVIIVNPEPSALDDSADLLVRSAASTALPVILGVDEPAVAG